MPNKRFNPTLCRGRVWVVINVARAAQHGLTWALGRKVMLFGVLAGNEHINSRIYQMLEQIDPVDVSAFVRKFRTERDEQRMHTFRELVVGSHLRTNGLNARYEQVVLRKTPDWVIYNSADEPTELVDVVSLHQRRETETDMLGTLSTGAIWSGWVSIPPNHLYAKIEQKANLYASLAGSLNVPYTVFLFGEFLASVDPEEVEYVLREHHGGLFPTLPTLAGLSYFTESVGTYSYMYYANGKATFPSRALQLLSGGSVAA